MAGIAVVAGLCCVYVTGITTAGINFWIHPQVVLKTDVQRYRTDSTKDRFNVGLGYMF